MKQVTLFFFLLFTVAAFGQNAKAIQSDTTYLEWDIIPEDWTGSDDSIFYEVRTVTYSNGREETVREAVGDTATTNSYFINRNVDINRQMAQAALIVIQRPSAVRANRVSDKAIINAGIGPGVYAGLDTLFWKEYLNASAQAPAHIQNYTATQAGTDFAATMRRMANGNVRLSFNGSNYVCTIYSDTWIRVMGYPVAGQSIDLFRTGPKQWTSVSGVNKSNRIIPTLNLKKAN